MCLADPRLPTKHDKLVLKIIRDETDNDPPGKMEWHFYDSAKIVCYVFFVEKDEDGQDQYMVRAEYYQQVEPLEYYVEEAQLKGAKIERFNNPPAQEP